MIKKKFISTRDLPPFPERPVKKAGKMKVVTVRSSVPGSDEVDVVETKDIKDPLAKTKKIDKSELYDGPPITTKNLDKKAEKPKEEEKQKTEKTEEPKKKTTRKRTTKKDEDKEEEK